MSKKKNEKLKVQTSHPPLLAEGNCLNSFENKVKNLQDLKSYQISNIKLKQHNKEQLHPQAINQQQKKNRYKIKSQRPSCSYDRQELRIKTAPDELFYQSNYMQTLSKKTPKSANNKSTQTNPTVKNSKDFSKKQVKKNELSSKYPKKKIIGNKVHSEIKLDKNIKKSQKGKILKQKVQKKQPIESHECKHKLNKKHNVSLFIEQKLIKRLIGQSEQSSHSTRSAKINQSNSQFLKLYNIKNYLNSIDMRMITKIRQDSVQLQNSEFQNPSKQQQQSIIQYLLFVRKKDIKQLTEAATKIQRFWRRILKDKLLSEYKNIFQNLIYFGNENLQQSSRVHIEDFEYKSNSSEQKQKRLKKQNGNQQNQKNMEERQEILQQRGSQQQDKPLIKLVQIRNGPDEHSQQSSQSYQSSIEGSELQFYNQYIDFECLSERRVCPEPEFVPSSSPQSSLGDEISPPKSNRSNDARFGQYKNSILYKNRIAEINQFVEYSGIYQQRFPIIDKQILANHSNQWVENVDMPIGEQINQSLYTQVQGEQLSQLKQQMKNNIQSAHRNKNKKSNWVNHPFFGEKQTFIKDSKKYNKQNEKREYKIEQNYSEKSEIIVESIVMQLLMQFVGEMKVMVASIERNISNLKYQQNDEIYSEIQNTVKTNQIQDMNCVQNDHQQSKAITKNIQAKKRNHNLRINQRTIKIYLQIVNDIIQSNQQYSQKIVQNLQHCIGLTPLEVLQFIRSHSLRNEEPNDCQDWIIAIPPQIHLEACQHIRTVWGQAGCCSPETLQLYDYWHCCLFQCFNQCLDQWRPYGTNYKPYPWSRFIKIPHPPVLSYLPDIMEMTKQKLLHFITYEVGTIFDKPSCPRILKNLHPTQKQQHRQERLRQFLFEYIVQDTENWVSHELQDIQVIMSLGIQIQNALLQQITIEMHNINVKYEL